MLHRVCANIKLQALQHNLAVARRYAAAGKLLAVIKANAYGHGIVPVAEALAGADMYGVTDIHEAERLRAAGTDKPILILQGIIAKEDIARIAAGGFQFVAHRVQDLQWLEEFFATQPPVQPITIWLKLQSGMGRLGIATAEYPAIYKALQAKSWCANVIAMTHLANASLPESALNQQQLHCFAQTCSNLNYASDTSIASSGGLLALDCASTWSRPGIMLYGSSPFAWSDTARRREAYGLQAVMQLQARLINISEHKAGDNIGYNSQFICPTAMRIGIVSCGYADGYPSNTPNGCPVEVKGQRTTTVGRVSMDMLAIDLSNIPQAALGDSVTLWGDTISLDEVAAHTGILSYNLTCSISARVPLHYV